MLTLKSAIFYLLQLNTMIYFLSTAALLCAAALFPHVASLRSTLPRVALLSRPSSLVLHNVQSTNIYSEKTSIEVVAVLDDTTESLIDLSDSVESKYVLENSNSMNLLNYCLPIILGVLFLIPSDPVIAASSDYGILAGRTASLIHPFSNFAFFLTSLYSAYLGFQWRNLRDIGDKIRALTKDLPTISTGQVKSPVAGAIASITSEIELLSSDPEASGKVSVLRKDLDILKSAVELDLEIQQLSETRKTLLAGNLKDKHHVTGSILLGGGVTVSVLGAFNTYMRAGRLFPGPHLYAGMAITILWAIAASLVPAMQKGNESARVAHIVANVINIALFAWQIPTGLEITLKVIEKTSW